MTTLTPRDLRCEYLENPLGLDVKAPRFSWTLAADGRARRQSAYQLLVASAPERLAQGQGDLWDSGRIESAQTAQIAYAGAPLASEQDAWWCVRVWDERGASADSAPAHFSMGLLSQEDWAGDWLCSPSAAIPYFRKEFQVERPLRRARLFVAILGAAEVTMNGQAVSEDLWLTGWTDYKKRVYYKTYDVTSLLGAGANAAGVILAPGWFSGYVGWADKNLWGNTPWFRFQLMLDYADGTRGQVVGDDTWMMSDGAVISADFQMGETYDARREMPGFDRPGFADALWQPAETWEHMMQDAQIKFTTPLEAHPGVPVRVTQRLAARSVSEPRPGVFVFDLGQNMIGHVRLKVSGPAGTRVVLRHAEILDPESGGMVYTINLRRARATDAYTLKGEGVEVWEPRFTFHGFRYVEVTGYPGTPALDAIEGVVTHSATPPAGSFECSHPMVNQLMSNIVWGQRCNFLEVPTDCPQRDERLGWTGDAQVFIRTAATNMDVSAFFTKWLIDLNDAQQEDGAYPHVAPDTRVAGYGSPAWGDAGVICPYVMWRVYGDTRVIEQHYAGMQRWIEYMKNNSEGLLRPEVGFGDWLSIEADTPRDVLATAYFAYSTALLAEMARLIGKTEDAQGYEELFEQIKAAFNKAYVGADGRIKGDTQTCYVLALRMNLLDEAMRAKATEYLVADINRRGHLSTGFVGISYLNPTLTATGHLDVAYKLLLNETFPSWGYPIKHGATTMWERWDGWTEHNGFQNYRMNSFNHYSFGSIGEWLYGTVAGIDTDAPGFETITLAPQPGGGLTWVKAEQQTMRGPVRTQWRQEGEVFTFEAEIPANTTATLRLPASDPVSVRESGKAPAEAEGVKALGYDSQAGVACFELGSGRYVFTATRA